MLSAFTSLIVLFFFSGYAIFSSLKVRASHLNGIAFCLGSGVWTIYLFLLLTQGLWQAFICGLPMAIFGFYRFLKVLFSKDPVFTPNYSETYFALVYLFGLYTISILLDPIAGYDPTAIWFLAGKMIYTAKSIGSSAGWNSTALNVYFHLDYPKLFAAISAGLATVAGEWDEYTPKLASAVLLLPGLCWLFSFYQRRIVFLYLLFAMFAVTHETLWTGFQDGFLALYCGLLILVGNRYRRHHDPIDFYSCLVILGVISNLKNEGLVLLICVGLSAAVLFRPSFKKIHLFLVPLLPALIWFLLKRYLGMKSELNLFLGDAHHLFSARLTDLNSLKQVWNALFYKNHPLRDSVLIFAILSVGLRWKIKDLAKNLTFLWLGLSGLFYFAALFIVYLSTPYDLDWHLRTSVDRTTLPLQMMAYAATYILLKAAYEYFAGRSRNAFSLETMKLK